ncbi:SULFOTRANSFERASE SULT [Salix koriyanagi]|uniref:SULFOTRANSFERASE SULT n=1 Tax=Salix koriyanagi TaxID=2511006 RepID=A0A9Q0ZZU9_9ROSI|nr:SULFOTRANSFERASE SULT [Salix koriyanagi]
MLSRQKTLDCFLQRYILVSVSVRVVLMENGDSDEGYDSSLPVEKWCGDDRLYQWKGCWFRLQYLLGTRQVLDKFKPLPSDVILASFPKTGTTWLKVSLIFHNQSLFWSLFEIQSSPLACANIRSSIIWTAAAVFQQLCQH